MPIFDDYIPQPLRFYDRVEKQNRFKKVCNESIQCQSKLITPQNKLLSFVIKKEATGDVPTDFYVVNNATQAVVNLDPALITLFQTANFDYLIYTGSSIGVGLNCGYYTAVVVADDPFFSEVFYVSLADEACFVKMMWTNTCDFNEIPYTAGISFEYYFDPEADVMERDPKSVKEGKENGNREVVYNFQKIAPVFSIETGLIPDYLVDAFQYMIMHNDISLQMKDSLGSGSIKNVALTGKWEDDSCYYNANIKFEVNSIIKVECCDEVEQTGICLTPCDTAHTDPGAGWVLGEKYMASDGRIKLYNGSGFIYSACAHKMVTNIDDSSIWCYDSNTAAWYPMPSVTRVLLGEDGDTAFVYAVGAPGSTITLFIDGVQAVQLSSEVFSADGFEFLITEGESYDLYVTSTSSNPVCNYGTSVVYEYTGPAVWIAPAYHSLVRVVNPVVTYAVTMTSVLCNAIQQIFAPVNIPLSASVATYAIGADSLLHLTNIDNAINAILPSGYRCYDDMRMVGYPSGETFEFKFDVTMTGSFGTNTFHYTYDPVNGFVYTT